GPNTFHYGADPAEMQQQTRRDSDRPSAEKLAERNTRRGVTQPTARGKSEDHRAESRYEAEGQVSAAVEYKGLSPREEVEEPLIECVAEVGVLVPVCREAGVVVCPVRRHADCLKVEVRPRHGIQRPCQPVTEENYAESNPLPARRLESEQEKKRIAKS